MSDEVNRKTYYWRIAALIIALGLASLLIFQFVLAEAKPARNQCEGPILLDLRTELAKVPTDKVEARSLLRGKIEMLERIAATCEKVTPATVNPYETPQFPPTRTPYPFVTGIFEGQTGVFHSFEAKIENHWRGIINGDRVFVYAGAWVSDPSQGFIAVHIYPGKSHAPHGNIYPSPTKSGALRIVDVKGSRLVIQQANDKKILFFDVPSQSYVNSLDEVVTPRTPTEIPNTVQPTTNPYPYPAP
jgi:hypothetical protein